MNGRRLRWLMPAAAVAVLGLLSTPIWLPGLDGGTVAHAAGGGNGNGNSGNGNGNGGSNGGRGIGNGNGNNGNGIGNGGSNGSKGDGNGNGNNGNGDGNGGGSGSNNGGNGNGNNGNGNGNGGGNGSNGGGNGNGNNGNGNGNGGGNGSGNDGNGNGNGSGDGDGGSGGVTGSTPADSGAAPAVAGTPAPQLGSVPRAPAVAVPIASVTPGGRSWSRGDRRIASGQLLVVDQPVTALAVARSLGFTVLEQRRLPALDLDVVRLRLPAGMTPRTGRALLLQRQPGAVVDYDDLYVPEGTFSLPPTDYPRRLIAWGVAAPTCGAGLKLGIIDTEVDSTLPALAAAHLRHQSFGGRPGVDSGHGTAIAAILVGGGSGLLPGATLLTAQIFGRDAAGDTVADAVAFAAALDWLVRERTAVVNLSLAGHDNRLVAAAVQRAAARGTILVAAAGNDGPSAPPAYPAAYPEVLAVAAVDSRGNPDPAGNRGDYIAFAAPGVQVWTPSAEGGQFNTGSSFAAPFVTAAAGALLLDGSPADRKRITAQLAADAVDLGPPGRDPVFGWGLVHARPSCATATAAATP
jgi:hypothetical protein